MEKWEEIFERLKENEATEEKFFQVEKQILSILNFRDLFNVLLTEIERIFDLPAVWLTLIEDCDAARLIPMLEAETELATRLRQVRRRQFDALLGKTREPLLVDKHTDRFTSLFPADTKWDVGSLALVPIWMDGEVIGSLNFGDTDPRRYTPDQDPRLLHRLGVKVSVCLSNVTAHEKLSFLAYHDALTGLLNRRVMANALAREVDRSKRYGHRLSVVFIDVDDFKTVNDTYGHECGDALLQHLAGLLSSCCRVSDIVARFAGDEFVLILPESDVQSAGYLMDRVCSRVGNRPLETPSASVPYSISFGIAELSADAPETPEALLQRADQQLYRVKRSKKPQTDRQPGRVIAFPESFDPSKKQKP